jgi:hypothetical protein
VSRQSGGFVYHYQLKNSLLKTTVAEITVFSISTQPQDIGLLMNASACVCKFSSVYLGGLLRLQIKDTTVVSHPFLSIHIPFLSKTKGK